MEFISWILPKATHYIKCESVSVCVGGVLNVLLAVSVLYSVVPTTDCDCV